MITSSVWRREMLSQMWSRSVNHNLYCSKLPYIEQHNGDGNLAMKMLHVTHHMMCCSVYSSTLVASLIPRLLCGGGGKRTWYTRSHMCKVPLVTCLLLKLMEIFCLPAERLHCKVILPVRHLRVVLKSETIITLTATVCMLCSRQLVNFERKIVSVSHVP